MRQADVLLPDLPTRGVDGQPFTPPATYVLLGLFDMRGHRDIERWRRLIAGDFQDRVEVAVIFLRSEWTDPERADLAASVPPSRRALTWAEEDARWLSLLQSTDMFAAVVRDGLARFLVAGEQTEEAWEAFRDQLATEY